MKDLHKLNQDRRKWQERRKWYTNLPAWMLFFFAIVTVLGNIANLEDFQHMWWGPKVLLAGAGVYLVCIVCIAAVRWWKLRSIKREIIRA